MMNNFQITEKIGRVKFQSWLEAIKATDIEFTEDEYCAVDCLFIYKNIRYAVEIKVRDERYKNYDTHILENFKLSRMREYKDNNSIDKIIYVNFFGDWLYIYDLKGIYEVTREYHNKTTAEISNKISKGIIHLQTNTALKFFNNNGIWEKQ